MTVDIVELDDREWVAERDAITRRFLGISAEEFVRRFQDGAYERDEPEVLMTVLAYFPELD